MTATVNLFGPFASRTSVSCRRRPVWTRRGRPPTRNGAYKTDSFTPTVPGVLRLPREIASTDLVVGTQSVCGDDTETTLVAATPKVVDPRERAGDEARRADHRPRRRLRQRRADLTIDVALFGPFDTRTGIGCGGTPLWTGTVSDDR